VLCAIAAAYFATCRLESEVPIYWNVVMIWLAEVSRKNLAESGYLPGLPAQFCSSVEVASPSVFGIEGDAGGVDVVAGHLLAHVDLRCVRVPAVLRVKYVGQQDGVAELLSDADRFAKFGSDQLCDQPLGDRSHNLPCARVTTFGERPRLPMRSTSLLAQPARSVTQIGVELGFSDTSSFSTTFHKHTGIAPTAYRSLE
jgi:AraC-like DNA-binding protein